MKKVKNVIFCFENLEQITIPISEVAYFSFFDVNHSISLCSDNLERDVLCAGEALIILKPGAERKAISSFDTLDRESYSSGPDLFARLIFERDCVGVDLEYESKDNLSVSERREIYVPWEDDNGNEYVNALQKAFIQNDKLLRWEGCLCVHFGEKWNTINNPDKVEGDTNEE